MGGEAEGEARWGFNDSGRNWGRISWREGQEWGEEMLFHVQGGGRSWGPDPRRPQPRGGQAMFQKEEKWGMDDVAMWPEPEGITSVGLLPSL